MTSREVMMRTVEALSTMGIREPQRILKEAVVIHEAIMQCPDDPERKPGRKPQGQPE